ncbi:MBL fold metallo-hydrolase [Macrococcus hajekii]|uniref:MBL fold metallo-hydrolase n=1 Tax=Macrococcus hajekii TaxID=198482 RepID=A0A4R6BM68_9STAP|nr:MBL fold metallo-hydrolase [Macrococcus hajekii]TDM02913.1 MBL fold metallo-hydrolase [Macrococcus hajekii]GGB04842.1 hydroxyacylglutathione hydrolase [Macrococcus hajekii]
MKIHVLCLGPIQTNCYFVENEESILVIDPGAEYERIEKQLEAIGKPVAAILLTHAHFDHIGAVDALVADTEATVYIGQEEQYWLADPESNGSLKFKSYGLDEIVSRTKPEIIRPGKKSVGTFKFDVIHTPGHSPGSVSYIFKDFAVVGDTLFKEGIGRTDLKEGNLQQLMNSIDQLLELPDEMTIYPGHGPKTTIQYESDNNPYL